MSLTPEREQNMREWAAPAMFVHNPYVLAIRDLLAEVDALRAAGDPLAKDADTLAFAIGEAQGGFADEQEDWQDNVDRLRPKVKAHAAGWRKVRGG